MAKSSKKKSNSTIGLVVVMVIILIVTVWYVISSSSSFSEGALVSDSALNANKYSSSLDQLNKILNSLDSSLFNNEIFSKLKSFITLPLAPGLTGKENPFAAPPAPEDLLQESSNQWIK